MKTKVILLALVVFSVLSSCKDDKTKDGLNEPVASNQFKITLNATVKKDDSFQLFFNESTFDTPYKEENSILAEVKGNEVAQDIVFVLPENVIPNYLRLDIGLNENQEGMTINNVKIQYLQKEYNLKGNSIFDNFTITDCIEVKDKNTGAIITKKNKNGVYDPIFYTGDILKAEIQNLIKQ
jgi:hypothetical protein